MTRRSRPRRRTASSLAPKGWLTGSEWNWGPFYVDIVKTVASGKFTGSKYNADYRTGYKDGTNPFVESKFDAGVDRATKDLIIKAKTEISTTGSPFKGPVLDQSGKEVIASDKVPTYDEVEKIFAATFVQGVVGSIPK